MSGKQMKVLAAALRRCSAGSSDQAKEVVSILARALDEVAVVPRPAKSARVDDRPVMRKVT